MRSFQFSVFSFQFSVPSTQCSARLTPHASRATLHARRGLSLIEVLASIGVISVGLLSLAALLPVGQWTIFEATKADRGGACGRAAMRAVVVRRMLDFRNWYDAVQKKYVWDPNYNGKKPWFDANGNPTTYLPGAFVIDPLGAVNGMNATLGNNNPPSSTLTNVPRISLDYANNPAAADAIFRAGDDLIATLPENMSPPRPAGRPVPIMNGNTIQSQGDYSWFLSVMPTPNNPRRFTVSVVVCYRRVLDAAAEQAVAVTLYNEIMPNIDFSSGNVVSVVASAGGTVQLAAPVGGANGIQMRENNWVALCSSGAYGTPQCRWYRVASLSDDTSQLTLAGPDWANPSPGTNATNDKLIAVGQDVIGVYTTTVDVDTDPTWKN
jgi:hypothetical protein